MSATVFITDLEAAINRARSAQPASGPESALTREVSLLAGLYGRMIWERRDGIDFDTLSTAEQLALQSWMAPRA
ncbi:MAG: DUF3717 domain-containing protein [Burkholderiales bacterium]|jgi:hypothetical protein